MIEEIICSERGNDEPGIGWERDILICRLKNGNETHFVKWVKVYKAGWPLPLDSVAKAAKEIMDKKIQIPITEILVEEPV